MLRNAFYAATKRKAVATLSMLLKGFSQFVEQPRVFSGDDRLRGEVLYQRYLLVGEWLNLVALSARAAIANGHR